MNNCVQNLAEFFLRMKSVSDKSCRENQYTDFVFNIFFPENPAVYGIIRKNIVDPDRPDMPCTLSAG